MSTLQVHVILLLLVSLGVKVVNCDDENSKQPPCDSATDANCLATLSATSTMSGKFASVSPRPTTTRRPNNNRGDPNKYGLVPPFLIGAASVMLIYMAAHCFYIHCFRKKNVRDQVGDQSQTSGVNQATLLVSDGPSTTSLAVRYDGAYGKTEIINATPYLLCHNASVPTEVAMIPQGDTESSVSLERQPSASKKGSGNKGGFLARFRRSNKREEPSPRPSVCSVESAGTCSRPEGDPSSVGSHGDRASLCFIPVGRALGDQQSDSKVEWTPVQGFMYNSPMAASTVSTGMKRDSSHTLVFVPLTGTGSLSSQGAQHNALHSEAADDLPLEGNASNMAVPLIVEDQASDPPSCDSSANEYDAIIPCENASRRPLRSDEV